MVVTQVTTGFAVIPRHRPRLTGMTIHRLMSTMATAQIRDLEDLLDLTQTPDDRNDAAAEQ